MSFFLRGQTDDRTVTQAGIKSPQTWKTHVCNESLQRSITVHLLLYISRKSKSLLVVDCHWFRRVSSHRRWRTQTLPNRARADGPMSPSIPEASADSLRLVITVTSLPLDDVKVLICTGNLCQQNDRVSFIKHTFTLSKLRRLKSFSYITMSQFHWSKKLKLSIFLSLKPHNHRISEAIPQKILPVYLERVYT